MSDRDFEIGGRKFKLNKIDAIKQFHIVRRIGPLLSDILPSIKGMKSIKDFDALTEAQKFDRISDFMGPLMVGLSKLSDEDADLVLYGLLQSVEVQQAQTNWARVSNGTMLMIQDLELPALLQIAGRAFIFNLSGFFGGPPHP